MCCILNRRPFTPLGNLYVQEIYAFINCGQFNDIKLQYTVHLLQKHTGMSSTTLYRGATLYTATEPPLADLKYSQLHLRTSWWLQQPPANCVIRQFQKQPNGVSAHNVDRGCRWRWGGGGRLGLVSIATAKYLCLWTDKFCGNDWQLFRPQLTHRNQRVSVITRSCLNGVSSLPKVLL